MASNDIQEIRRIITAIPDPEIPVITIEELGILRDVQVDEDGKIYVKITPTYSGCPAMMAIENDIKSSLKDHGYERISIELVFSPVWTTDWIPETAKEKLRQYGIAPPPHTSSDKSLLSLHPKKVQCPRCGSASTVLVSQFGSTACKALYKCEDCHEPFDHFKCH
ncbi:MAG: 1,2-phenylacetyl-CoA epoxidase subunit PaaD [Bacteroidota bacterium]